MAGRRSNISLNEGNAFERKAKLAGFSNEQIEFMWDRLAKVLHTHRIEDIEGLEEELDPDNFGSEDNDGEEDDEDFTGNRDSGKEY